VTTETTDEGDPLEDVSYVLSSKYRERIVLDLVDGATTPTTLADENNFARPHVSRALSELSERDLVVSHGEGSRTKLYTLSEHGERVAELVEERDPEGEA
jgi:predicted transcriptional regulator